MIRIDEELCKGCDLCIDFCPMKLLARRDRLNTRGYYPPYAVDEDECVGCRLCELMCPEFAIFIINE